MDPRAASTWSVVAILVIGFWTYNEFVAPIFGLPTVDYEDVRRSGESDQEGRRGRSPHQASMGSRLRPAAGSEQVALQLMA